MAAARAVLAFYLGKDCQMGLGWVPTRRALRRNEDQQRTPVAGRTAGVEGGRFSVVPERTVRELRGVLCSDLEDITPAKQQIMASQSLGSSVFDLASQATDVRGLSRLNGRFEANCCPIGRLRPTFDTAEEAPVGSAAGPWCGCNTERLDRANAATPEDVGDVPGYADCLEAILDPNHPEHHTMWESPCVRLVVAPIESKLGGDDERATWRDTDKHSKTERRPGSTPY